MSSGPPDHDGPAKLPAMPDTESDHRRGDAAVARLDLVALAPPAAPATITTSSCATAIATASDQDEEDGFTFSAVDDSIILHLQDADGAFPDARIGSPVYPVFGRPRWLPPKEQQQQQDVEEEENPGAAGTATVRVPLGRLLLEEPWCDNADAELDGVPAETYCLWSPGASPPAPAASPRRASPARCRKSRSRGGGKSSSSTSFLPCKQDLVELVASVVTCRRSCYLF